MDDRKITSNDFDYDVYTGGSSSSGSEDVTSGNFDYDVYSGSSAMEYLRQENERKRQERERARKSEAELRREEYEKKFAGMTADEIFAQPKKKKEDEYADFFSSTAAKKEAEKDKLREETPLPKVENMMPGEDDPSSQPRDEKYRAGVTAAAEMIARQRIRSEFAQEHWERARHSYYRRRRSPLTLIMADRYTGGDEYEIDKAFAWYMLWFGVGCAIGYAVNKFMFSIPMAGYLIFGGVGGVLSGIVKHNGLEHQPLGGAVSQSKIEIIAFVVLMIVALGLEFSK